MQSKKQKRPLLSTRNVVIFEGPERNRSHWTIDIVDSLIIGKDGVTKAVKYGLENQLWKEQCSSYTL